MRLEGTRITSDRFLRAVNGFFGLLNNVSDEVNQKKDSMTWIVEAKPGSLIVTACPEPGPDIHQRDIVRTVNHIRTGVKRLERKSERPEYFSDTALRHVRDLASILSAERKEIKTIQIENKDQISKITPNTVMHIDDIIGTKRKEEGSVEGRVTVISDRWRFSVFIDDIVTGQQVRCTARKELESKLIAAFRKRVIAIGTVGYTRDGEPTNIDIDELRILGKKKLPSFADMRGILKRGD